MCSNEVQRLLGEWMKLSVFNCCSKRWNWPSVLTVYQGSEPLIFASEAPKRGFPGMLRSNHWMRLRHLPLTLEGSTSHSQLECLWNSILTLGKKASPKSLILARDDRWFVKPCLDLVHCQSAQRTNQSKQAANQSTFNCRSQPQALRHLSSRFSIPFNSIQSDSFHILLLHHLESFSRISQSSQLPNPSATTPVDLLWEICAWTPRLWGVLDGGCRISLDSLSGSFW
jgi:hypothetical protein